MTEAVRAVGTHEATAEPPGLSTDGVVVVDGTGTGDPRVAVVVVDVAGARVLEGPGSPLAPSMALGPAPQEAVTTTTAESSATRSGR
ncbi:MAG: hypothetical protein ACRDZ8_17485 [Acidimicrobiales bacterium]